jgi:hypothetical protein
MEILVTNDDVCTLVDVDNFKEFHVDAANTQQADAAIAAAIGHGAQADGAGHIWVSADRVRDLANRGSDPDWQRNFTRMLEAVRPYGWCSEDLTYIRAHVKRS